MKTLKSILNGLIQDPFYCVEIIVNTWPTRWPVFYRRLALCLFFITIPAFIMWLGLLYMAQIIHIFLYILGYTIYAMWKDDRVQEP